MKFITIILFAFFGHAILAEDVETEGSVEENLVVEQAADAEIQAYPVRPFEWLTDRIVNGKIAATNQFPWQASIRMSTTCGGASTYLCGGSIISNRWILTAGHCVSGFNGFLVGVGSNTLNSPAVSMNSCSKILHTGYIAATLSNDIGLVLLPRALVFAANIQPIRLPRISQISTTFAGFSAQVSGFGRLSDTSPPSSVLRWADMSIITNAACAQIFGSGLITPTILCAYGSPSRTTGTCNGDSGGPFEIFENKVPKLVGVVSFVSSRGCAYGHPSGYTRVSSYIRWISSNTGIQLQP